MSRDSADRSSTCRGRNGASRGGALAIVVSAILIASACQTPVGAGTPAAQPGGGALGAGANVAAGAVLWIAAGGCKLQGCPGGAVCNPKTELCDPAPCGSQGCPVGSSCNTRTQSCVPTGIRSDPH